MEFQEQKKLTANNNQYLISFYKLNNNKNPSGYKVMSYYVFAMVEIKDKIIAFESNSLQHNNQVDMEKSILSIKLINTFNNEQQ